MGTMAGMVLVGVLLIIAGLMDTFAKSRPDIGIPIIVVGIGSIIISWLIARTWETWDKKSRR
jgi:ABC-type uncharacterized transport system permease subunit